MKQGLGRLLTAGTVLFAGGLVAAGPAAAQATLKPDGKWRHAVGLGLSYAKGNSDATTFTLNADGVRQRSYDKWSYYGKALRARSDSETTGEQIGMGTRYDRDLNARLFAFGQGDLLRDKLANLSLRSSVAGGLGYHVIRTDDLTWDVFAGLGYTRDSYVDRTAFDGRMRSSWGYAEVLLGEESNHQLTETASFRQRLVVYPNLSDSGEFRAQFDAGLAVAMSSRMSLTATLAYRYASLPGDGLKKGDVLFVTGISAKLE